MIEIASSAAPQLGLSFAAGRSTAAAPARPKILRPTLPSTAAENNIIPMTGKEHPIATLYPSKSSLMVIATTPPTDAGDSQIPIARAADRRPSDSRFPFLGGFRTPAPSRPDGKPL